MISRTEVGHAGFHSHNVLRCVAAITGVLRLYGFYRPRYATLESRLVV